MNPAAFLNIIRGLFKLVIFWTHPQYEEQRKEVKSEWHKEVVQPFKEGWNNPTPASEKPVLVRKPFKIMLCILIMVFLLAVMFGEK